MFLDPSMLGGIQGTAHPPRSASKGSDSPWSSDGGVRWATRDLRPCFFLASRYEVRMRCSGWIADNPRCLRLKNQALSGIPRARQFEPLRLTRCFSLFRRWTRFAGSLGPPSPAAGRRDAPGAPELPGPGLYHRCSARPPGYSTLGCALPGNAASSSSRSMVIPVSRAGLVRIPRRAARPSWRPVRNSIIQAQGRREGFRQIVEIVFGCRRKEELTGIRPLPDHREHPRHRMTQEDRPRPQVARPPRLRNPLLHRNQPERKDVSRHRPPRQDARWMRESYPTRSALPIPRRAKETTASPIERCP
jgi:hypothetical protein